MDTLEAEQKNTSANQTDDSAVLSNPTVTDEATNNSADISSDRTSETTGDTAELNQLPSDNSGLSVCTKDLGTIKLDLSDAVGEIEVLLNERAELLTVRESNLFELQKSLLDKVEEVAKNLAISDNQISATILQKKADFEKDLSSKQNTAIIDLQSKSSQLQQEFTSSLNDLLESIKLKASNEFNDYKIKLDELTKREQALTERELAFSEEQEKLEQGLRNLDRKERRLESREDDVASRENKIEERVQNSLNVALEQLQKQVEEQARMLDLTRQRCTDLEEELNSYREMNARFDKSPEEIMQENAQLLETISRLKNETLNRPSKSLLDELDVVKQERDSFGAACDQMKDQIANLTERCANFNLYYEQNKTLLIDKQNLTAQNELLQLNMDKCTEEINRLKGNQASLSTYNERVAEIKKGILEDFPEDLQPCEKDEMTWLNNIWHSCAKFGIAFPKRILYAFHTALKISDWSCITVLAGVSGTGKSELPRLYSAFGGINFLAVPVQPNWDSQESMLGYFNSIDNRFEPEELLRFLVQCTEDSNYKKYMSLVLLDEMNLAHVEHYFADFLSKLESRRSCSKNDVPKIEVKLGAGVEPFQLQLSRTVLWTGTMNQDETTKSLSDKVLDRGVIINFPRPKSLVSRSGIKFLKDESSEMKKSLLSRVAWNGWIQRECNFTGEQQKEIDKYRNIVEQINDKLENVGRAIGHRVWQSIEFYILNYPTVVVERNKLYEEQCALASSNGLDVPDDLKEARQIIPDEGRMSPALQAAMSTAFEDQLVQKIMPKLRGVETRGRSKESLDEIETLLIDNNFGSLKEDFDIACRSGYGQFIWSSAKYIEDDSAQPDELVNIDSEDIPF